MEYRDTSHNNWVLAFLRWFDAEVGSDAVDSSTEK